MRTQTTTTGFERLLKLCRSRIHGLEEAGLLPSGPLTRYADSFCNAYFTDRVYLTLVDENTDHEQAKAAWTALVVDLLDTDRHWGNQDVLAMTQSWLTKKGHSPEVVPAQLLQTGEICEGKPFFHDRYRRCKACFESVAEDSPLYDTLARIRAQQIVFPKRDTRFVVWRMRDDKAAVWFDNP